MLVLYGSQTGSAEEVAERVARDAERRNLGAARVQALDAFDRASLPGERLVVFVVATTGDGDPPDNMRQFWRFLLRKGLPRDALASLEFVVFGLGDSSYAHYNVVSRKLRARLLQLGAVEAATRGFGDDQSAHGLEGDLDKWLKGLWPELLEKRPLPPGFEVDDSPRLFTPANAAVAVVPGAALSAAQESADFAASANGRLPLGTYAAGALQATLARNERITATDWEQDVRHVEFAVPGLPAYEAGDIAVVHVENAFAPGQLERLAAQLRYPSLDAVVELALPHVPARVSLRALFTRYLDLLGTPRRRFFEALYFFAGDAEEKDKLLELSSAEGNDLFHAYCKKERKSHLEVLTEDFKTCAPPLHYLVQMVPLLKPREYSIASSRRAHGNSSIHLTVAMLSFLTPWGRRKTGVASQWFQSLPETARTDAAAARSPVDDASAVPETTTATASSAAAPTAAAPTAAAPTAAAPPIAATTAGTGVVTTVTVAVKRGMLRVPEHGDTPLVLVGPGTGVAPMRGLIYERRQASSHLYFGCRSAAKDYYYEKEWAALVAAQQLGSVRAAFSRDSGENKKVYVQKLLREDHQRLHELLVLKPGLLFVSGSAERMPTDVREAVTEALAEHLPSLEHAQKHVKEMERTGRFRVEAWS